MRQQLGNLTSSLRRQTCENVLQVSIRIKACFVASEVVADQLAIPVAQKGSGVFASAARAEVVNDRSKCRSSFTMPLTSKGRAR
jgi:hypothetical protein